MPVLGHGVGDVVHTDVVVIGAGIGGIATAARLAKRGFNVTIVEKNARPGGRCDRMIVDGHYFDTGPTIFLMPGVFAQTFADLGERMADHLDLHRIDPSYQIHFDDGVAFEMTSDLRRMKAQLEAIERGSYEGYLRYLHEGYTHYRVAFRHIIQRNFRHIFEYANPKSLWLLFKLKPLVKHYANMGRYFDSPRLKALFTFQDMYVGLNPADSPATFSLLPYSEFSDGVWYPMGGMYAVIEALTRIAESYGVKFEYDTQVSRIYVNGRRAEGVILMDGTQMRADIVVANADIPYVYRELLPDRKIADAMGRKKLGCSTLSFLWGVDRRYPELSVNNLFLSSDYLENFDQIFNDLTLPDDPSFYVHAPVCADPSMAPDGHDTITAIVPVGHMDDPGKQNWVGIEKRARQAVLRGLKAIGVDDLEQHIKFEKKIGPTDWRDRYHLTKGSTHGLSHVFSQLGYLRPRNRHDRYRNLYFVGASTHPGTGLPTVLISASLASERILEENRLH
jgi:phytoene desaturase